MVRYICNAHNYSVINNEQSLCYYDYLQNEDTKVQNPRRNSMQQYYTDVIRTHARIIIALRKVDAQSPLSSAIYTCR